MIWYVAVGSAVGGASRYLLGIFIQQRSGAQFPVGTLVINITGSLLLGFLLRYATETPAISPEVRALLTTGFCGGYTTFSTYSYETAALIEEGQYHRAAMYVVLSVAVALAGTFVGLAAARKVLALRTGA
jgi:CrcB protein